MGGSPPSAQLRSNLDDTKNIRFFCVLSTKGGIHMDKNLYKKIQSTNNEKKEFLQGSDKFCKNFTYIYFFLVWQGVLQPLINPFFVCVVPKGSHKKNIERTFS